MIHIRVIQLPHEYLQYQQSSIHFLHSQQEQLLGRHLLFLLVEQVVLVLLLDQFFRLLAYLYPQFQQGLVYSTTAEVRLATTRVGHPNL